MNVGMHLGLGGNQVTFVANIPDVVVPVEARIITEDDYTLTIEADVTNGGFLLSVSFDGTLIGDFALSETEYLAQAHNLTLPQISGDGAEGTLLTVTPGLWLIDPDIGLVASYEWLRDGVVVSATTEPTYLVQPDDQGSVLTCREIVGIASVLSNAVDIPSGLVELLDVTAPFDDVIAFEDPSTPIPGGVRLVQNTEQYPKVEWNTVAPLVNGTTYRLTGSFTFVDTLVRKISIRIYRLDGLGQILNFERDPSTPPGTLAIDETFVMTQDTQAMYLEIYAKQEIGSTIDLVDFSLTEVS